MTMRHTVGLATVLAAFWLALSGHYTPLMLGFAAASIALVLLLVHRMDIIDHENQPLRLGWRAPSALAWLMVQILQSSWNVTRRIWTGRPEVRPAMGRVPTHGMSDVVQVTYANWITLTPGTLSVALHDEHIEIHALDAGLIRDLEEGSMAARARRLEQD
jgi:multicomponent Na+:H+ antiporter subunit E